jgi:hypothetical protein
MIKRKKIFYVNSRNRTSGTNSNFFYSLNLKDSDRYSHAVILQASIPKSYYLVVSGQNTFTLTENGSDATITISPGNYNRKNFKTTLQTLLNAGSPNGWTYAVSIPSAPDTGYYNFTVSGNAGLQPSFTFTTYLYEQLGFNINSTVNFVGDSLSSVNVISLQKETTIFLHSSLIGTGNDNVIQEMYSNANDFDYITYHCINLEGYSKRIINISDNYWFYLTDENDNEINLNGQNVVFTLMVYEKDDINNLIEKYIKFKVSEK